MTGIFVLTLLLPAAQKGFVLSGIVTSSAGEPVSRARVSAVPEEGGGRIFSGETGADGRFRLAVTSGARYRVRVTARGFADAPEKELDPGPGRTDVLEFILLAAPNADRPKFETAGIRGLIDPGGYSAPAASAAAANVVNNLTGADATECASAAADVGNLLADRNHGVSVGEASEFYAAAYQRLLSGDAAGARDELQKGLVRFPDSEDLLIGLGSAQYLSGETSAAVASFLRAADQHPGNSRAYAFLGSVVAFAGPDLPRITNRLERFSQLEPSNARALYWYADALLLSADTAPKAEELLRRAVAMDRGLAAAWFELGRLDAAHGRDSEAIQDFESAVAANPKLASAHYKLGALYRRKGDAGSAAREFDAFSRLSGDRDARACPGQASRSKTP